MKRLLEKNMYFFLFNKLNAVMNMLLH